MRVYNLTRKTEFFVSGNPFFAVSLDQTGLHDILLSEDGHYWQLVPWPKDGGMRLRFVNPLVAIEILEQQRGSISDVQPNSANIL